MVNGESQVDFFAGKETNYSKGILVCGSGIGTQIAANKVRGIRAVAAYDLYTARMSRLHNDSNVLAHIFFLFRCLIICIF
jgi:RpiB/LacA/LacB family sugar-phosphate isomerase